jgi:hypothetical protein
MSEREIQDLLERSTKELLEAPELYTCRCCGGSRTEAQFPTFIKDHYKPCDDGEQVCDECISHCEHYPKECLCWGKYEVNQE